MTKILKLLLFLLISGQSGIQAARSQGRLSSDNTAYQKWTQGPSAKASFFPIAVWLQDPGLAGQYKKAGFNTYIGLWNGPTEEQLATLTKFGMKVICEQNEVGLRHLKDSIIIGWMHGDEPDNAQSLGEGKGYGPPVPPSQIIKKYQHLKSVDPTRPVMLNLGQGVAWDEWVGRGVRTNHREDYPEYMKGGDIISFDIYPVVHPNPAIRGKLGYVAKGVKRLVNWGQGKKIIWNCLECTHIGDPNSKASPEQVRAEAWMAIINGSRGLIYFVHQFKPSFNAAALLDDPVMLKAVAALNHEITRFASVINSADINSDIKVQADIPIVTMLKKYNDTTYLFTVSMLDSSVSATFTLPKSFQKTKAGVANENRSLNAVNGIFKDHFKPWEVHIYCFTN